MNVKEIIGTIRQAITEVKGQNQPFVSVAALERYLGELEAHIDKVGEFDRLQLDSNITMFRAEHERNLAHYEAIQQLSIEMFRSVISYGQAALKTTILINGGAAVALLAFIGRIWGSSPSQAAVDSLTNSIVLYSFGVLASAMGTATTYLTQYSYHSAWKKTGIAFHIASVLFVLVAFVLFGVGSYEAYVAFVKHLSPN